MDRIFLPCALLALTLLTGCGAVPKTAAAPEPPQEAAKFSPSVREDAQAADLSGDGFPVLPEERTEPGATVEYTQDLPITVDGGRALTLRLRCRAVSSGYGAWTYGVGSIDVLEGDALLQTILVGDAIQAASIADGVGADFWPDGFTSSFEETGGFCGEDLNFDGAEDFRLIWFTGTVNSSFLCWLWDLETEQFSYAFCLLGYDFRIDQEARQLVTEARGGWGNYYTNFYAYDEDSVLQHVKEIRSEPADWEGAKERDAQITVHQLIDGAWVQTQ